MQALTIEMFKITNGISLEITSAILTQKTNNRNNPQSASDFQTPVVRTVSQGVENISNLEQTWMLLLLS